MIIIIPSLRLRTNVWARRPNKGLLAKRRLSSGGGCIRSCRLPLPVTPLELRSGRRLLLPMQRESSHSGSNAAVPVQPTITITSRQREPPFFAGLRGEDAEEWLDQYERVSAFNGWDDAFKLRNVSFSLKQVAETWFFNQGGSIDDWASFKEDFRKIFGTSSASSAAAKKKLDARVQLPEETYASYIEDVIALCRRADKDMPETEKVRHIIKGIASFAFNAMAIHNPNSIADVRTICQRLDHLQSIRIQQDTFPTCPSGYAELRVLIRDIIREELQQRDTPYLQNNYGRAPGLRDMVREELVSMTSLPQPCHSAPLHAPSYSEAASRLPVPVEPIASPPPHGHLTALSTPSAAPPFRSTWRAPRPTSDRPVCYYCGIRGHISRFCRRRQLDERRGYAPYERDNRFSYPIRQRMPSPPPGRSSSPPDAPDLPRGTRLARRRSPSPYRRSLSPLRPVVHAPTQQSEN